MQKKAFLALLMAAVMLLSGCSLIVTDVEKDNARIVLDVNVETMTKGAIDYVVNYTIEQNDYYNNLYYQMLGQSAGYSTDPATVLGQVLDQYIDVMIQDQKAQELGLTELGEADMAMVEEEAAAEYENMMASIESAYLTDSENEGEALRAEAEAYAAANGYATLEDMTASLVEEKIRENLKAEVVKDVTVTEEELEEELAVKVAADKDAFTTTLSDYGYEYNNGNATYYVPAGYRYVKQVLVKFDDEHKSAITEKQNALTTVESSLMAAETALANAEEGADLAALEADVEAAKALVAQAEEQLAKAKQDAYNNIFVQANEISLKAQAGEDFAALIEAYNEDPGMEKEPGMSTGYAVCADYIYFEDSFVEGAMALENVGDVSAPIEGSSGYFIIRYEAEAVEGGVALDTVRDTLTAEMLTEKQDAFYTETLAQWEEEADIKTYPEKMGY